MPFIDSFTAIDFETAHPKGWSICQVGLVRIENGVVTDKINLLVQKADRTEDKLSTLRQAVKELVLHIHRGQQAAAVVSAAGSQGKDNSVGAQH